MPASSTSTALRASSEVSTPLDAAIRQTTGIPFYDQTPWAEALRNSSQSLDTLPRISKSQLRAFSPEGFLRDGLTVKSLLAEGIIEEENTSGTSGASVRVIFGRTWWAEQELRALRGNRFIATLLNELPDARRAVFTTPGCSGVSCFNRWLNLDQRRFGQSLFVNQARIPFTLGEEKLSAMAREAADWQPVFLDVDPVHGAWFALHCERNGIRLPSLRFILTSYEYTSIVHRRIMERVFGIPVINLYGSSETGHLLVEEKDVMHPIEETALLEVVETDSSGIGQLLVTTLTNPYLPLLRYEIGDYAEKTSEGYLVHGRQRDALRRADGSIATTRQVDQLFASTDGIAHYQLRQKFDGTCTLLILPERPGAELTKQRAALSTTLSQLLGQPVDVQIVDLIPPEDSGKFRLTVRDLA
jgi:phenylacetate-CoA ligase